MKKYLRWVSILILMFMIFFGGITCYKLFNNPFLGIWRSGENVIFQFDYDKSFEQIIKGEVVAKGTYKVHKDKITFIRNERKVGSPEIVTTRFRFVNKGSFVFITDTKLGSFEGNIYYKDLSSNTNKK